MLLVKVVHSFLNGKIFLFIQKYKNWIFFTLLLYFLLYLMVLNENIFRLSWNKLSFANSLDLFIRKVISNLLLLMVRFLLKIYRIWVYFGYNLLISFDSKGRKIIRSRSLNFLIINCAKWISNLKINFKVLISGM